MEIGNILGGQIGSYEQFLQHHVSPKKRENIGLQAIFNQIFPIISTGKGPASRKAELQFIEYRLVEPELSPEECCHFGSTYFYKIYASLRLIVHENSKGEHGLDGLDQQVFLGEIPAMTDQGSFVINGTERVVVSQLRRSPGVIFSTEKAKSGDTTRVVHTARIIPNAGAWLDFEFDAKDCIYMRVDRKRKLPCTVILRALDMDDEQILDTFFETDSITLLQKKGDVANVQVKLVTEHWYQKNAPCDIKNPEGGVIVERGRLINRAHIRAMNNASIKSITCDQEEIVGRRLARDVISEATGELIGAANATVTIDLLDEIRAQGVRVIKVLHYNDVDSGPFISDTLKVMQGMFDEAQQSVSREDALKLIYSVARPSEPTNLEHAEAFFRKMFFEPDETYDLSPVGRLKINLRLNMKTNPNQLYLDENDIVETLKMLVSVRDGHNDPDDIDHLGNRRVRTICEMLQEQFRIGMARVKKVVAERLGRVDESVEPSELLNPKPVSSAMRQFFNANQLSQFMEQVNPLAAVAHKRRLSAMGPNGLTRERAGHEVRDVHATHYGRLCPVESPEGANIGLINSLASYARIDQYGFIETPYRVVENGQLTDKIEYLSALNEGSKKIAQIFVDVDDKGYLPKDRNIPVRVLNEFTEVPADEVEYIDVAPNQCISLAASLIPFQERNDAKRALMGANMQRQAVGCIEAEKPLVGTGQERVVARDSGTCIVSKHDGKVLSVDSRRIVVSNDAGAVGVDIYPLVKYGRSNQGNCLSQTAVVRPGDLVKAGEVLADGSSVDLGELALGRNVRVAFMMWNGYNFEDSIILSDRLIKDDVFTSIHIKELVCTANDTKLGQEEITADIPGVNEEYMQHLDDSGIVRIGARVKANDILVGRTAPKSEKASTSEERLLEAIFGDKSKNVRDVSLRVPNGSDGTVISVQVLTASHLEKDERAKRIATEQLESMERDRSEAIEIMRESLIERITSLLNGVQITAGQLAGTKGTAKAIEELTLKQALSLRVDDEAVNKVLLAIKRSFDSWDKTARDQLKMAEERLSKGENLPAGTLKVIKVRLAVRRTIQQGDKMSGRHGNKGVVSVILPAEEMPFDENGEPVDIVLNPLGIPSRMNVGQVLETNLGWAAKGLGRKLEAMLREQQSPANLRKFLEQIYANPKKKGKSAIVDFADDEIVELAQNLTAGVPVASPVFDGASEDEVRDFLELADLPRSGTLQLFDGTTGEKFDFESTVGYMYMLKLDHLVEDKMHARSTGSYSLVTQQPMGGKAHNGGQRFGEMEVWALEAYGAAHTLREILTVKSDDIRGRSNVYKGIVEGNPTMEPGMPESFHVLRRELRALAINLELDRDEY